MLGQPGNPGIFIATDPPSPKRVFKYQLAQLDTMTRLDMPEGAKVVEVAVQHEHVTLWAVVDSAKPLVTREFHVVGTGEPVPANCHTFHGTVHMGSYVFHVFEGFMP